MPAKATHMKGRPTLYKSIRMRSRLEADYAAYLDRLGRAWEYEPDCFASEAGQWLPDFRVTESDLSKPSHLVELKPSELLVCRKNEQLEDLITRIDGILARVRPAWVNEPDSSTDVVFWRYGAPEPDLSIVGSRDKPWSVWLAGCPIPFLWIGAGQAQTLGTFHEVVAKFAYGTQEAGADDSEEAAHVR